MQRPFLFSLISIYISVFFSPGAQAADSLTRGTFVVFGTYSTMESLHKPTGAPTILNAGAVGAGAGLLVEFATSEIPNATGIELGLLYSIRSAKSETYNPTLLVNVMTDTTVTQNVVELPILAKFHFGPLQIGAGGYVGFPTSEEREVVRKGGTATTSNISQSDPDMDYGLTGALGFSFGGEPQEPKYIVELRYNHGLADTNAVEHIKDLWREGQLLIGYIF